MKLVIEIADTFDWSARRVNGCPPPYHHVTCRLTDSLDYDDRDDGLTDTPIPCHAISAARLTELKMKINHTIEEFYSSIQPDSFIIARKSR